MSTILRPILAPIIERLREPRRFIQVIGGPRQVGKTTLVRQALAEFPDRSTYASADIPATRNPIWLEQQWEAARLNCRQKGTWLLALDEIQKVSQWDVQVKRFWDEDSAANLDLRVVLLGSSPLLVQRGLTESLAGRFELLRAGHWTLAEMQEAFGWNADQYIFFGGYPGAAELIGDEERWRRYLLDSLIETTLSRDILLMTRVDKPALLRQLFRLGCEYSGQILSYQKMLGQLQDAGNTTTLAHYLDLLGGAGMVCGIQKFAGQAVRRRASSPKLQVLNNALKTAQATESFAEVRGNPERWGRLVESAVGAYLGGFALAGECEVFYWREVSKEVDFVLRRGDKVIAIEVKSGASRSSLPGMAAFDRLFHPDKKLLVGSGGIPVDEFLRMPAASLF
ncbi:MAG: ATP-binding protein [Terracidiphilus sp.]